MSDVVLRVIVAAAVILIAVGIAAAVRRRCFTVRRIATQATLPRTSAAAATSSTSSVESAEPWASMPVSPPKNAAYASAFAPIIRSPRT